MLAGICGSLDSVLNIAFPDLTDDLELPVNRVGLIIVSYVAVYGFALIPAGRLADRRGGRFTVAVGGAVTCVGLAVAAFAPGLGALLLARVVQGAGTALVMAAAPALLTRSVDRSGRGRALGIFQTSAGVGLTIGPLLGGPIVAAMGWRAVFALRIPLFIVLVAVALFSRIPVREALPVRSAHLGGAPVRSLLRNGDFVRANLANVVANGAAFTVFIFGPTYMVDELGASEFLGGIVLALWAGATALAAPVAGRLTDRHGPAPIARIGLAVLVAGLVLGAVAVQLGTLGLLAVSSIATGAGLGLFTVANMTFVMGSLTDEQQGVAGGITLAMRTAGIIGAVGTLTVVFTSVGGDDVTAGLTATFITAVFAASAALLFRRPAVPSMPGSTDH